MILDYMCPWRNRHCPFTAILADDRKTVGKLPGQRFQRHGPRCRVGVANHYGSPAYRHRDAACSKLSTLSIRQEYDLRQFPSDGVKQEIQLRQPCGHPLFI